jgi:hypothetical protein
VTREPDHQPVVGTLGVLAFVCELAMIALLAAAGWRIGTGTGTRLALAIGLPAVAVVIWARWMAPASAHRLRHRPRLAAQTALFVAVGSVCVYAGLTVGGVAFAVVATAVFAAVREGDRRAG